MVKYWNPPLTFDIRNETRLLSVINFFFNIVLEIFTGAIKQGKMLKYRERKTKLPLFTDKFES